MSFVRVPRRSVKSAGSTKRKIRNKPEWDDTKNDLTVYKATPEEVDRRKQVHQSKNVDLVRADKLTKKISKARRERTPTNAKKKQLPLLREMLYDQNQLRDVLAKSDKAMAVVRDLFGDDPKRYRGLPNVTVAPNQSSLDGSLPTGTRIEGPSKLDVLSDSVMDKSALNEYNQPFSDSDDEEHESLQYKPMLDFARFRTFLELEQQQALREDQTHKAKDAQKLAQKLEAEMAQLGGSSDAARGEMMTTSPHDGSYIDDKTPAQTPRPKAMNDTEKCQRTRSRLTQANCEPPTEESTVCGDMSVPAGQNVSSSSYNMDDLRTVLEGLEGNLAAYERQTGRAEGKRQMRPETFSGYTMSLVNAVSKLTIYLKESEARLRAECTLREQLNEDVEQLNAVIDTLTTDLMSLQDDYTNLQDEFYKHRLNSQQEMHSLKASLVSYGIPIALNPSELSSSMRQNQKNPQQNSRRVKQHQQSSAVQNGYSANQETGFPGQKPALPQQQQQQQHLQQVQQQNNQQPTSQQGIPQPQLSQSLDERMTRNQHMQMMMMQQMIMAQSLSLPQQQQQQQQRQVPLQHQHFDTRTSSANEDTLSLEQHPLSSSMTSQGSGMTSGSANTAPPQVNRPHAATLLSPPRQSNGPRDPDKISGRNMGKNQMMNHLRNMSLNRPANGQNNAPPAHQPNQQQPQQHTFPDNNPNYNLHQSLRNSQNTQFKPLTADTESNPVPSNQQHQQQQQPTSLYFNNEDIRASQQKQPGPMQGQSGSNAVITTGQSQDVSGYMMSGLGDGAAERVEVNRGLLAMQIEQLNKQHAEAESKLEHLLLQQYNTVKELSQDSSHRPSPPISPIAGGSESDTGGTIVSDMSSFQAAAVRKQVPTMTTTSNKGITISLPKMDMLNWSDTSTPTLSTSRTQSRLNEDSPVPVYSTSPADDSHTPYKDNQKFNMSEMHQRGAFQRSAFIS